MTYHVRTQSGSLYLINTEAKTWERLEETEVSGPLRTDSGDLSSIPAIKLDEPMIILGPPIRPWTWGRVIMTTAVVEVLQTSP